MDSFHSSGNSFFFQIELKSLWNADSNVSPPGDLNFFNSAIAISNSR
jgi:hypothetical protein